MKRITPRLVVIVALWVLSLRAADPTLVNLARPDVNFMLGIHVSQIAASPLMATTMEEAQRSNPDWYRFVGLLGSNPFQYLDEIVVSARLDEAKQGEEPDNLLVVARGAFSDNRLSELLCSRGCEPDEYREFPLVRIEPKDSEEPAYFTFLDSQYAAMGKLSDVRGVIDRRVMETQSVFSDAMQEAIGRLGNYDVWLAAKGPIQSFGNGQEGPAVAGANVASKIDGFGLGLSLGSDVEFALELQSHSQADAKQLYDMAQGFLALFKSGDAKPETKKMLESLNLRYEGKILGASLRIPEAEVRRQLREQVAKRREQAATGTPVPPPTRPRREGGIRIYGLEQKPVEVPVTKQ